MSLQPPNLGLGPPGPWGVVGSYDFSFPRVFVYVGAWGGNVFILLEIWDLGLGLLWGPKKL